MLLDASTVRSYWARSLGKDSSESTYISRCKEIVAYVKERSGVEYTP